VDRLPGIVKPNLDDLGPNGTITTPSLDLNHLTLRAEPSNPGDWSSKLGRLQSLASIAGRLLGGTRIDKDNGVYSVTQGGELVVRAGVFGPALVLSNDPRRDLAAAAAAPVTPTPPGAAGALTLRAKATTLIPDIPALIGARLGDITGWMRAELTGVTGELDLALN
jgi:mRNA-degrading endonuclease toxin of MazEF toxin-antitoxin module